MSADLNRRTWSPKDEATRDEKDKAALYVASIADNRTDCHQLLAALDLLPVRLVTNHGMTGYRAGCKCTKCRKANANRTRRQRAARASAPGTTTADCPINTTTRGNQ